MVSRAQVAADPRAGRHTGVDPAGGSSVDVERARAAAATVTDPELPMITLADLGVLRAVRAEAGRIVVEIAPTYSGCPAMSFMRLDVARQLRAAGFGDPEVRTVLDPPWSSDDITARGRTVLAEHGIAPPNPARRVGCPVPLMLGTGRVGTGRAVVEGPTPGRAPGRPTPGRETVACPQCGSTDTVETSHFGSTACKALYRCRACAEPFEYFKAI